MNIMDLDAMLNLKCMGYLPNPLFAILCVILVKLAPIVYSIIWFIYLKKMRKMTAPGGWMSPLKSCLRVLFILLIIGSFPGVGSGILNPGPLHTKNRIGERNPLYFLGVR